MGMHVRAARIGILLLRVAVVVRVGLVREAIGVMHVRMYERMRLSELGRNHDVLHDLLHGAQQSRAAGSRQVAMSNGEKLPRGQPRRHNLTVTV